MAQLSIVNGPGKFDLMLSLFDGTSMNPRTVAFTVNIDGEHIAVRVAIQVVGREDGSGESWLFDGFRTDGHHHDVRGYYDTRTRRGWMKRK